MHAIGLRGCLGNTDNVRYFYESIKWSTVLLATVIDTFVGEGTVADYMYSLFAV